MKVAESTCTKPESSIGSPALSNCGSSCVPQAPCSKLGRDFSAPCLTRKASQTSLHRSGGSTPGVPPPPPSLSGGSCPAGGGKGGGGTTDRDGQKAAPRGFGSSTGRGLMEARFRRTASAVSVRGEARCTLPRGEREKDVAPSGGSACSSALAGNNVGIAGPSRSGTAPRQRSSATNAASSFSVAHAQLMNQDGPRTSQGVARRVMADDGLDVDLGLAERLRERIRSRLGGAAAERNSSGANPETSAAGDFRRDNRNTSSSGTSCSSRRAMDSRLRRQPQTEPGVAQRSSPMSSVAACSTTVTGLRPSASSSSSALGIAAAGPSRSPVAAVVKAQAVTQTPNVAAEQAVVTSSVRREASPVKPQRARSPPPVITAAPEPTVVTTSVTREPSPLKPHRSPEAVRPGPCRSYSGQLQGSLVAGPGQAGFVRSSSSCSRAGRSPSPSDHDSNAPSQAPHLTRQASGFFLESASVTSLRSSSSLSQILGHRQAGAPPVATRNVSITRLVSGVRSDSGRSSGSATPARQDESVETVWDDDVQACAVAFERALSRAHIDSDVCAELRRVRERYEALLQRPAPRAQVHLPESKLQSTVQKLESENAELRRQLARLQFEDNSGDCDRTEMTNVSATSCAVASGSGEGNSHGQLLRAQVQSSPQCHTTAATQGQQCIGDLSVGGSEESPLPPMRRVFAPPTPAATPLKGEPGVGAHTRQSKSPGPLAWANLVDADMVEGDSLPRHPVRTPPLGSSQHPMACARGIDGDSQKFQSAPCTAQSDVVTPRAVASVSNPPRPVSWTAPPALRCGRGEEGHDPVLMTDSPRHSDEGSPSPAPSRREAMAAAWLREIDPLTMSCRSDQSDSLPQRPQRRAVRRPSSVPPLDLTGIGGSCAEDSDVEVIGIDDNSYEESSGLTAHQLPSPTMKYIRDATREAPGPLTDNCSSSGNGGSSTASTRAASTPSANAAGGPPSPCPQVAVVPQPLVAKTSKAA